MLCNYYNILIACVSMNGWYNVKLMTNGRYEYLNDILYFRLICYSISHIQLEDLEEKGTSVL